MTKYKNTIFITGATGNLGSQMVLQLLEESQDTKIVALVRGQNKIDAKLRLLNIINRLSPNSESIKANNRLEVVSGDVEESQLGLSNEKYIHLYKSITHIIHCAASTKFSATIEKSRSVNYAGTKNVLKLAEAASSSADFKMMAHISTAYVCGHREGDIFEDSSDDEHDFLNNYEQSKWETEQLVRSKMSSVPISIFRPSIIVGDTRTGRIVTFNVLYPPLKFLCQGVNFPLPLRSNAPIDVIPVDYAARSILYIALSNANINGKTFHIVAGNKKSCTVDRIVSKARELINSNQKQASTPGSIFNRFAVGTKKLCRAAKLLDVYLPYMTLNRNFDDSNTQQALENSGICVPPLIEYLGTIMEYFVGNNWGKNIRSAA